MAAEFWQAAGFGLLAVLIGSVLIEASLAPRPCWRGRPAAAWRLHLGICLATYALEWLLFQRAYFGAVAALSTLLLLVVVSNVKAAMLREPFLWQDFEYFTDLLRHPRLYLPFFGIWNAAGGLAAFALCVYAGFALEPSLPSLGGWGLYLLGIGLLAASGIGLIASNRPPPLSFDPTADLQALGFLAFLWEYGRAERQPPPSPRRPFATTENANTPAARPNLVVVQSESFFDARRLCTAIAPQVMAAFDDIRLSAQRHGLLDVPAFGANTVRTEFAFLSGLGPGELGVHRFNPYRKLAAPGFPTLAAHLRDLGYRTVCVHPYWPSFYRRDRIYPGLGFDEFIGIADFAEGDYCGPYVGDIAVGRKIQKLLHNSPQPIFIFAITMENHGPLHWESITAADETRLYQSPPPAGFDDLTVYLRHVENAGQMLRDVAAALASGKRGGGLCWYGDHVPIMPKVYANTGFADSRSDYFIWRTDAGPGAARNLRVEALAAELLATMAMPGPNEADA